MDGRAAGEALEQFRSDFLTALAALSPNPKNKPAAEKSAPAVEKDQKTAKADKPRGKRVYWNEARIMRELYRYGAIAGGW